MEVQGEGFSVAAFATKGALPFVQFPDGRCFTISTCQASVQVLLRFFAGIGTFQQRLYQVDASARAIQLIPQYLVGRAGGIAEPAVHAAAKYAFGLVCAWEASGVVAQLGLHGDI